MITNTYNPRDLFAPELSAKDSPRAIIAPHRYIQGNGVIDRLGNYLTFMNKKRPILFITKGGEKRLGQRLTASLDSNGIEVITEYYESECSIEEIEQHVTELKDSGADCLITIGGGKCLDTGKAVAHFLSLPTIICPTIASTDAPCSSVSVIYTPEGEFAFPMFFPEGPAFVIVDSGIIANSPPRHLVAGMGDALATYYEARTCLANENATNEIGTRPTATANAIAKLGAKLLFENGTKALEALKNGKVNDALENVIEANTLISGVGFESGGLSGSHGIAQVFPVIPRVEEEFLHGEMVAFGILGHLCLEHEIEEAKKVARFLNSVGLPTHLAQLTLNIENKEEIDTIINASLEAGMLNSEPFEVTRESLAQAIATANQIGLEISKEFGDAPYKQLHSD